MIDRGVLVVGPTPEVSNPIAQIRMILLIAQVHVNFGGTFRLIDRPYTIRSVSVIKVGFRTPGQAHLGKLVTCSCPPARPRNSLPCMSHVQSCTLSHQDIFWNVNYTHIRVCDYTPAVTENALPQSIAQVWKFW